jgi:hypothetical protein
MMPAHQAAGKAQYKLGKERTMTELDVGAARLAPGSR